MTIESALQRGDYRNTTDAYRGKLEDSRESEALKRRIDEVATQSGIWGLVEQLKDHAVSEHHNADYEKYRFNWHGVPIENDPSLIRIVVWDRKDEDLHHYSGTGIGVEIFPISGTIGIVGRETYMIPQHVWGSEGGSAVLENKLLNAYMDPSTFISVKSV